MKKTCTNSKCRKKFTVDYKTKSCPYCGKKYPRILDFSQLMTEDGKYNENIGRRMGIPKLDPNKKGIWILDSNDWWGAAEAITDYTYYNSSWDVKDEISCYSPVFVDMNIMSYSYDKNLPQDPIKLKEYIHEMTVVDRLAKALTEAGCKIIRTDK